MDQLILDNKNLENNLNIDIEMYLFLIDMYHYYNMVDLYNDLYQ
jgi:hypothetical protein